MRQSDTERPTAVLVGVQLPDVSDEEHAADLTELARLCKTLGLEVVGQVTQRRNSVASGTVLGEGKLEELALWTGGSGRVVPVVRRKNKIQERREREAAAADEGDLDETDEDVDGEDLDEEEDDGRSGDGAPDRPDGGADAPDKRAKIVVVDQELTPRQHRNLEKATEAEVLDRSMVIVEIFHRHAKSREARIQVEIARLTYVAPRLREAGAGADRQRGGIGGKGAGESAVELDRRRVRDRVAELRRELSRIEGEHATRRAARRDQRRVALVGYTNAGKSSLMRALTGSEVLVADKLFATLDTTVRAIKPEAHPRILVSDTVGFIKKLPHELVASFRSTLDEALEASLLLFLADASDPTFRSQLEVTRAVLAEIGSEGVPSLLVLNKRDRLDPAAQAELAAEFPSALLISTRIAGDVTRVYEHVLRFFDGELVAETFFVPYSKHGLVRRLHETENVLEERHDEQGTHVTVRAARGALERLRAELGQAPGSTSSSG